MSNSLELRIPFGLGESLREHVFQGGTHEQVAFGLVSHMTQGPRAILCLQKLIPLQETDYIPSVSHGAVWRGSAMFPIMGTAMDGGLGIVVIHAHDHKGPPRLSSDDFRSAEALLPMFRNRVPGRPHGTVVISRTHASGLIWMPGTRKPRALTNTRWFGASIMDTADREIPSRGVSEEFGRQSLVVGGEGQSKLQMAKVAVVGAGGGGSHVIQQLAYLGVGEIVVIDPDVYHESNRHRLVSAVLSDLAKPKVNIFERLVRKIGLGGRVRGIRAAIPDAVAVQAIRECDVIVGCVDTLFSRSDLQEVASRYLIPYVDIGATVRGMHVADSGEPRVVVAGNVFTYIPGSFCLWCCGFLSPQKIEAEQNGPTRGYFEKNRQEAQVVSFNGVLASQAVSEVLQLLTGYRGSGIREADLKVPGESVSRGYKKFDGVNGTLQEWGGVRRPGCDHCEQALAAGDVIFT
jgi:ThiF family